MNKLKKIWMNNRILFVLAIIVIICFIIIAVVVFQLFFGTNASNYGDRLETIKDVYFKEEDKNTLLDVFKENEAISNMDVHTQGKIIYIRIVFQNVSLSRAKEIAATSLESISDELENLYDIHYTILQEKTETTEEFILMGAKNINRSTIIWNNNTSFEEIEE